MNNLPTSMILIVTFQFRLLEHTVNRKGGGMLHSPDPGPGDQLVQKVVKVCFLLNYSSL